MADGAIFPGRGAHCPLCGGFTCNELRSYGLAEAARAFAPANLKPERHRAIAAHLAFVWGGDTCRILECGACRFAFSSPFQAGDATFYELVSPDTAYPKAKWEFVRTCQALRDLDLLTANVLEIGAGNGSFLRLLLERGASPERLTGTEFSSSGRAAIEALGVACFSRDVRVLPGEGQFDAVCMFQVLEHMTDYPGLFAAISRLTKRSGHVFIAVPNGDWIASNEARGLLLDMPPNHVSRWQPEAFESLAGGFGFRLEACEYEPPRLRREMQRSFTDRYVRRAQTEGSWENRTARVAARLPRRGLSRLVQLFGASTSPACWSAAASVLRDGAMSPNLWAHLRKS